MLEAEAALPGGRDSPVSGCPTTTPAASAAAATYESVPSMRAPHPLALLSSTLQGSTIRPARGLGRRPLRVRLYYDRCCPQAPSYWTPGDGDQTERSHASSASLDWIRLAHPRCKPLPLAARLPPIRSVRVPVEPLGQAHDSSALGQARDVVLAAAVMSACSHARGVGQGTARHGTAMSLSLSAHCGSGSGSASRRERDWESLCLCLCVIGGQTRTRARHCHRSVLPAAAVATIAPVPIPIRCHCR